MKEIEIICDQAGQRLDKYIKINSDISRSQAVRLINDGNVLVNHLTRKPSYLLCQNDVVLIKLPDAKPTEIIPQDIKIDIVFEDKDIIVINKPRGMVVHPSAGHEDGTLVNALMYHCPDIEGIGGELRPGIVHRIDKDTTGLLVVAKNEMAMKKLSEQIAAHSVVRTYYALVEGKIAEDGTVDAPIGRNPKDRKKQAVVQNGKYAFTTYKVSKNYRNHTLLKVNLKTGRTHQIRVHMAYISHPVVGDKTYGYKKQRFNLEGQLLHAVKLEFVHPITSELVEYDAPMPEDFLKVLKVLENQTNPLAD